MTFRAKLLLAYLLVLMVSLGLFYWWTRSWLERFYLETVRDGLEQQLHLTAATVDPYDPELARRLARVGDRVPYRLTLFDREGRVVTDSRFPDGIPEEGREGPHLEELQGVLSDGRGTSLRFDAISGRDYLYVAVKLPEHDGILRLGMPLEDLDAVLVGLRRSVALLVAGLLLMGSLIVFWVSRSYSSALAVLNQASRRIADGDFVRKIPLDSSDEAGRLARNMESMSSRLQGQMVSLESEKNFLDTILSSMTEGILVADRRGRVSQVNPSFNEIFDVKLDPVGRLPLEVVRNEEVQEGIRRLLSGELSSDEQEIQVAGKTLGAHFSLIHDQGRAGGVVTVFHDITRLRRLEKIRKEFVSNVSHELRTPLTSIQGYAETLTETLPADSESHRFAERIHRNSQQLSHLIEDLLKLARLESSQERLEYSNIRFSRLMKELERDFQPRLLSRNVRLSWSGRLTDDTFRAGEAYIRRAFHNLIDNALKYTERGEIRVEAEQRPDSAFFAVHDSGVGIPKEDLGRIFERFYRVGKDRARRTGGSGVGLSIVKHIVQLHGGQVWAESQVGKGTTVCFTIPDSENGDGA